MVYQQRYDSIEFVPVIVEAAPAGQVYDPTGDSIQYQFVARGANPSPSGWHPGAWEIITNGNTPQFRALCLAGPGQVYVPAQNTLVWLFIKITDNPEVPVLGPMTVQFT